MKLTPPAGKAIAVFAEGCFWCSEHIFEDLAGVDSAVSGYSGGHTKNPTYEEVCSENTGHAEAVLVYYNPKVISYDDLTINSLKVQKTLSGSFRKTYIVYQ